MSVVVGAVVALQAGGDEAPGHRQFPEEPGDAGYCSTANPPVNGGAPSWSLRGPSDATDQGRTHPD